MGETRKNALRLEFNQKLKLEFHGTKVTGDAGLLAYRELLMNLVGEWVDRVHQRKSLKQIIPDMDSSVSPTYGNQEGSAYNGYFARTCYHPLFCFNQFGDLERALLRNGYIHSADDWRSLLEPIVLYHSFRYQAASWKIARRVVAKIELRKESGNMFDSQRIGVFFGLFHVRGIEIEPNVAVLSRLSVKKHCL